MHSKHTLFIGIETRKPGTLGGLRARLQGQLMIGDQGRNVSPIMLGVLVSWVTLIFVGFGINAPRNAMVAASFLICAVVIGGAIFLILEMDRPVQGVLQISSWPIRNALAQMNW